MIENPAQMEQVLMALGQELKMYRAAGNVAEAGKCFRAMMNITGGAKLRIVGIMLQVSGVGTTTAAGKAGREKIHHLAAKLAEKLLFDLNYQQKVEMLTKAFGTIGKRVAFGAAATPVLLFQTGCDVGNLAVKSSVDQMTLRRIALYDDYLRENEGIPVTQLKTYDEWLASEHLPALHKKQSEFFDELRVLFPHTKFF
jgi:hypothetical protein